MEFTVWIYDLKGNKMPRLADVSDQVVTDKPRALTGEIYDLCNLGLNAVRGSKSSRDKGIALLLREIRSRNSRVDAMLYDLEQEGVIE
jgi:hypothetical protein